MDQVIRKAYGKVNLGLDVVRKREDGYHELKMIMQTVGIWDELCFQKRPDGEIRLEVDKYYLPSDERNLVYKAAKMILEECGVRDGVFISLKKRIPVAAGMAGGSTDGAAVFHGLNELFGLGLDMEGMCRMGVKIGADVPYCIMGGTALAEGIGEILTPLPKPPECAVLVVKPGFGISSKYVYENLRLDQVRSHPDIDGMMGAIQNGDLKGMAERMENVLESVTAGKYPVIERIKGMMKGQGALGALMSGSGSTVFGVFEEKETAEKAGLLLKEQEFAEEVFLTEFV